MDFDKWLRNNAVNHVSGLNISFFVPSIRRIEQFQGVMLDWINMFVPWGEACDLVRFPVPRV